MARKIMQRGPAAGGGVSFSDLCTGESEIYPYWCGALAYAHVKIVLARDLAPDEWVNAAGGLPGCSEDWPMNAGMLSANRGHTPVIARVWPGGSLDVCGRTATGSSLPAGTYLSGCLVWPRAGL